MKSRATSRDRRSPNILRGVSRGRALGRAQVLQTTPTILPLALGIHSVLCTGCLTRAARRSLLDSALIDMGRRGGAMRTATQGPSTPPPHTPPTSLAPGRKKTKLVMGGRGGLAITDAQAHGGSFLAKRAYGGSFRLRCSCETPCGNDMTTARIPLSARRFAGTLERSGRHGKGLRWEYPVGAATRGNAGENRNTPRGCVRNPRTRTCDAPRGQSQRGDQRCGGL